MTATANETLAMRDALGRLVRHVQIEWAKEQTSTITTVFFSWEYMSDQERELARRIGTVLYRLGLDCAKAVCEQRAENERVYNDAGRGESNAAPYKRAAEDIEAFKYSGVLRGLTGAYPGSGVVNPLSALNKIGVDP